LLFVQHASGALSHRISIVGKDAESSERGQLYLNAALHASYVEDMSGLDVERSCIQVQLDQITQQFSLVRKSMV
jgi:hypothetical protein